MEDETWARGAYKTKDRKVLPVNEDDGLGSAPEGRDDWEERAIERERRMGVKDATRWDGVIHPKTSALPRGTRLTGDRIQGLSIGMKLRPKERDLLITLLLNRKAALSWEFEECEKLHPDVAPPQIIRTKEHVPFQVPNFKIARSLETEAIQMLRTRKERGLLEDCHGPYRNPWFLVTKKDGKHRLINACTKMNSVTLKNAYLPPCVEDFVEDFAGMEIGSVLDIFSGYDQVELARESRNLTAFQTPIGLLRMTTLPQGATNSVTQFVRIISKVLRRVLHIARPFIDDIGVKGPKTRSGDREAMPGVRLFVLEHLKNLDDTLLIIERAGLTVAGKKLQLCAEALDIVGYICDSDGRHPNLDKVSKIRL